MEASEGLRPRNPLAKTLSWVRSLSSHSRQRENGETGKMLAPEVGTSSLSAGRSIVASSSSKLPRARKMKDESHIVGREDFVNKLVPQLIDKRDDCANLRVISVVGEGAIGKTTLVRSVYNRADIKNHFDCCAWVRVGLKPNLIHLMVNLLKQLRVPELRDVDRLDEEKLSEVLLEVLMECCYLLVLDDLCDLHVMDKLIMVLADTRNGSRVIITTRYTEIPSSIDPWYSKHLELSPLDLEQSINLLEESSCAFDGVDPSAELLHLKDRILSKSGGSPTKIILLGGLLSANKLSRCTELVDQLPDHPTVRDVLYLSFNDLPEGSKQCALHLALFPKESELPPRRLCRLWSAENLPSELENGVNKVDTRKCFEDLVSRNIVRVARRKWDGSARSCLLPGTLYDVFSQMAKNRRFLKIYDIHERLGDKAKFDAPRIAIHRHISGEGEANEQENGPDLGQERSETNAQEARMEITLAEPHQRMSISDNSTPYGIKELHSYVSFNTMKLGTQAREIEVLLKPLVPTRDSTLLRVLDLEGVFKPLLPEEFGYILVNLKYLGLRWTLLESLPKSVVQLFRLETLDLKYTNITQVPVSIWEAENLQHLYMNEVSFDESVHPQLHSKISLNCNIQTIWGLSIEAESPMLDVLRKLTGLKKLALTCHPSAVTEVTKQISNLKMLESLRLQSKDSFDQPSDLVLSDIRELESLSNLYLVGELQSLLESHIPRNLKVLTLSMSGLIDNLIVLGKLKWLTTLRLFGYSYYGQTLRIPEETFLELRVLKLWKLKDLTEWTIQGNAMQGLEDLEIKDCKNLKTINGLEQIATLERITLVRVPDELEQSVRDMCPNVLIIAKELVLGLPRNENKEEHLDEEDSRIGEDYDDDDEEEVRNDGDRRGN